MAVLSKRHSPGLGAMRGLAALGVVGWHALLMFRVEGSEAPYRQTPDFATISSTLSHLALGLFNGPAYVTLFFVLSGTVLAMSAQNATMRLPDYWLRRGFRLYPLLVVMASVGALLQLLYFPQEAQPGASDYMNHHYKVPASDVAREWIFNAIGYKSSLNNPAWSIKVELLASFAFPLVMSAVLSRWGASLAVALSLGAMFLLPWEPRHYAYMNVFALSFVLGAIVPIYGAGVAARFHRMNRLVKSAAVLGMLAVLLFSRRVLAPDEFAPAIAVLPETIASAGLIATVLFDRARGVYSSGVLSTLAELSYSVYLVHVPVLFVVAHMVVPPEPMDPASALAGSAALAATTIAITLPLAWLTYNFVERPMQYRSARRTVAARACELGADRAASPPPPLGPSRLTADRAEAL